MKVSSGRRSLHRRVPNTWNLHPTLNPKRQLEELRQTLTSNCARSVLPPGSPVSKYFRKLTMRFQLRQRYFPCLWVLLHRKGHSLPTALLSPVREDLCLILGKFGVFGGEMEKAGRRIPGAPILYGFHAWVQLRSKLFQQAVCKELFQSAVHRAVIGDSQVGTNTAY